MKEQLGNNVAFRERHPFCVWRKSVLERRFSNFRAAEEAVKYEDSEAKREKRFDDIGIYRITGPGVDA